MTTCKVAGTVNITGNTQGDDKAASNLPWLPRRRIRSLAGKCSSDSRIGLNADLIRLSHRAAPDTNVFIGDRANICAVIKERVRQLQSGPALAE